MKAKSVKETMNETMHWDLYRENLKRRHPNWNLDIKDEETKNTTENDEFDDSLEFNPEEMN